MATIILFAALGLVGVLAILWLGAPRMANTLLFLPSGTPPDAPLTLGGHPGESLVLTTSDGVDLEAWWHDAGPGTPAVLLLHGNAGHLGMRATWAEGYLMEGISTLLLGYRGYGRSEGRPDEAGVARDVMTALDFLREQSRVIVVHGRSLGGAAALAGLDAAESLETPQALAIRGVILESTFTSLEDIGRAVYPFFPGFVHGRLGGQWDSIGRVGRLGAPVFVIHGAADDIIPARMGREMAAAALNLADVWEVGDAGHNDLPLRVGDAYVVRTAGFVRSVATTR